MCATACHAVPCCVLLLLSALSIDADSTFIDLTHPQSPSTLYWPGVPKFNRTIVQARSNENNIWIEVGAFSSGEHGGTHIDAPRHFYPAGYDLKDLPLENTIAEGIKIDVKAEADQNPDYALTLEKVQQWEKDNGQIPNGAAILVYTGRAAKFSNHSAFLGTNDEMNSTTFHFPIVSKEAAQWLVDNRSPKILGMDVPSPDGPRDTMFPVHIMMLSRNIVILENVMITDKLPARGYRVHAAPMRIEKGTGVQTRVYAMLNDPNGATSGPSASVSVFVSVVMSIMLLVVSGW